MSAETVAKAAEEVSKRYVALHTRSEGVEQTIYGELAEAFQDFAEMLRKPESWAATIASLPTVPNDQG